MTRIRLDIAYDGSGFSGWARQAGQRTVQQEIEDGLRRVLRLGEQPHLTVAGRTDAGVHARGQVAHVDVVQDVWAESGDAALRSLAGVLPPDVRVLRAMPAPDGFNARFSAVWRRYAYRVCDDPAGPDPLRRHETLWYPRAVDAEAMTRAAQLCLGEHDFAAFCRRRRGASSVRALLRLDWARPEPAEAVATIVADAFCHNMVRALIGALLRVGDGARPVTWPADVLAGRTRDPAVTVLPPHGLCLEEVGYPAADQLAARAQTTRRLRGEPAGAPWPGTPAADIPAGAGGAAVTAPQPAGR